MDEILVNKVLSYVPVFLVGRGKEWMGEGRGRGRDGGGEGKGITQMQEL